MPNRASSSEATNDESTWSGAVDGIDESLHRLAFARQVQTSGNFRKQFQAPETPKPTIVNYESGRFRPSVPNLSLQNPTQHTDADVEHPARSER